MADVGTDILPPLPTDTGATFRGVPVSLKSAFLRGLRRRCPCCGEGAAFTGYLTVAKNCPTCGVELDSYRSDDAPAYFTIVIVGHIIVPAMLMLEQIAHPATWVHMALWLPLTLGLTLALLPFAKGALLGVQWALRVKS
ncbi:MAG TPA: DUF983 domain-containing protein [Alphaproteobacteria bacterium]|jgi:uncharacterized protein (DUF983 family)